MASNIRSFTFFVVRILLQRKVSGLAVAIFIGFENFRSGKKADSGLSVRRVDAIKEKFAPAIRI